MKDDYQKSNSHHYYLIKRQLVIVMFIVINIHHWYDIIIVTIEASQFNVFCIEKFSKERYLSKVENNTTIVVDEEKVWLLFTRYHSFPANRQ